MAYGRNRFIDNLTAETYDWPVNHSEEERMGKERTVAHGAPTGNLGLIRQQGESQPMVLQLTGTIFHASQHAAMWNWFERCQSRTIDFIDTAGDHYEVLITSFMPQRRRTLSNPRDPSIRLHYWSYTIAMEVLDFKSGALQDVTP
jgi:hypothetical protein